MKRVVSVQLTLWLVGILGVAMAIATIVPQRAPADVYDHALGHLIGPLIYKSALRDVYGSWWFIGAFGLLAVNLAACSLRRARQLLRRGETTTAISRSYVRARPHWSEWQTRLDAEAAAGALSKGLGNRGYAVRIAEAGQDGESGLRARRGKATAWGPVLVHIGMAIVLFGAAYGRLPAHSYRAVAALDPGNAYEIQTGGDRFSVRLLEAGAERDEQGRATRFWARAEVLEDGKPIKSALIEPNHPLRHRGVNMVLQSLTSERYLVEVTQGETTGYVPVILTPDGAVAMMETVRRLEDPPWVVFIHDFRSQGESAEAAPAARVFVDRSGHLSHNWDRVGWVGERGLSYEDVRFRLTSGGQSAQLLLDRDIGVPFVWAGFCVVALGGIPLLGLRQRAIVALIATRGAGSSILIGGSDVGTETDVERTISGLDAKGTKAERCKTLIRS